MPDADRRHGSLVRSLAVLAPGLIGSAVLLFVSPIPQDPAYHHFADQREIFGIPFFGDVITNLAFAAAGLHGLWILRRNTAAGNRRTFEEGRESRAYLVFFSGLALTGLGSGYYHLHPDNASLFWDRLPLTAAFMAFFSIAISERIHPRMGASLLWPLILLGAASVVYWHLGERSGEGDLRFYALVQYYPMLAVPLMLCLYPPRYSHAGMFWWVLTAYAMAKGAELLDGDIFGWIGFFSGHNLKHLFAAAGAWLLAIMLMRRRPLLECPGSPE